MFFFQGVQVPYTLGLKPRSVSKWQSLPRILTGVVYREVCTEGSQTAKSGTDEQKLYMRL